MDINDISRIFLSVKTNIKKVIIGKDQVIDLVIAALFCGGHVLIEDVPGTGKTLLGKSLSATLEASFKRIQFTPDLLPSDVTGINVYNMQTSAFEFLPGAIFSNILLADEINRAMPKTQAGLLECMEENQVTVDGVTRKLNSPFMVIATQNPIDTQGVFPLPEAQLDRFMLKIPMQYTSHKDSVEILNTHKTRDILGELKAVVSGKEIAEVQRIIPEIYVHMDLMDYIVSLVEATRNSEGVVLGVSLRGGQHLMKMSQAVAAIAGRDYVIPDDIKYALVPVFAHRLILRGEYRIREYAAEEITEAIKANVPVPTEWLRNK